MDGSGVCRACRALQDARRRGVPPAPPPELPEAAEGRLLELLAPLRQPWVRQFLDTAYRRKAAKTRQMCLRTLGRFDRYLIERTDVGSGQWSLVTVDHIHGYLAKAGRFHLEPAKAFFTWLRSRKKIDRPLARLLPKHRKPLRLRLLPTEQVTSCYSRWTAVDAHPPEAIVGLLALVHCLRSGEIRGLKVEDVIGSTQLRVGSRIIPLAEPVAEALARYLTWRGEHYAGPSTYLLVSRASRLHDRPVSAVWFRDNLLGGISVASLRQTAIRHLIQGPGCDGLQLASHAGLSLAAVGTYMSAFSAPVPWPPSSKR